MSQSGAARLFSTRNVMGIVLIAGIGAGIYLGDFLKGPGLGGSSNSTQKGTGSQNDKADKSSSKEKTDAPEQESDKVATVSSQQLPVLKVVVADRNYLLRTTTGDEPISLKQIVSSAAAAKGDEDGIKVRVYRKPSSRASTELALKDALAAAGIGDEQTVWVVNPVDE